MTGQGHDESCNVEFFRYKKCRRETIFRRHFYFDPISPLKCEAVFQEGSYFVVATALAAIQELTRMAT
ncbi:hypothetical protein HMPREF2708_06530 [Corynebacterium sp. HMSC073H12]|nr:hypothetical protein HMPREF2708_06530 [Corynebacterium sp. HMSC073H12]